MASVIEDVEAILVSANWVAEHYGVRVQEVYRAVKYGRLQAVRPRGSQVVVFDVRKLPEEFPSGGSRVPS